MSNCVKEIHATGVESSITTSILAHADLREAEGDGEKAFLMSPPRAVHSYG